VLFLGGVAAWAVLGGPSDDPAPSRESAAPATSTAPEPSTTQAAPPETTTQPAPAPSTTAPVEPPAEEQPSAGSGEEAPDAARARRLNDEGYALSQAGQDEQAVPVLQRALAAWPEGSEGEIEYAFTLFNLAHSLRVTGNPEDAIPLLERRLDVSDNQRGAVRRELRLAREEAGED
jgi:tetratricopeptide (TPR) repeat protein